MPKVMTLGSLGYTHQHAAAPWSIQKSRTVRLGQAIQYHAPILSSLGALEPFWRRDIAHPAPTTPQYRQNLLRPTGKGCSGLGYLSGGEELVDPWAGENAAVPTVASAEATASLATMPNAAASPSSDKLIQLGIGGRVVIGLSAISSILSLYHGYRRNNSLAWGLAWGVLGAMFPVITPTVAVAQGFGKRR